MSAEEQDQGARSPPHGNMRALTRERDDMRKMHRGHRILFFFFRTPRFSRPARRESRGTVARQSRAAHPGASVHHAVEGRLLLLEKPLAVERPGEAQLPALLNGPSHWTFRPPVLALADPEHLGQGGCWNGPRFLPTRAREVRALCSLDDADYKVARVRCRVSDRIDGKYRYLRAPSLNEESRDIGQFVDDDGSAYLIFESSRPGFFIASLSGDYLNVREAGELPSRSARKGAALVHYKGLYYVVDRICPGGLPIRTSTRPRPR